MVEETQNQQNPEFFLRQIEDFRSTLPESGIMDVESTVQLHGLIENALNAGASNDSVILSLQFAHDELIAERHASRPINSVMDRLAESTEQNNSPINEDFLSGVLQSSLFIDNPYLRNNEDADIILIEHAAMLSAREGRDTLTAGEERKLVRNILHALETGSSYEDVSSAVLRLRLRNPDISLVDENGPDFLDALKNLAEERGSLHSVPVTPEFLDTLRNAANAPANGSELQALFIESSSKSSSDWMTNGHINPTHMRGLDRLMATVKFNVLALGAGGKEKALGFNPDKVTKGSGHTETLEHDGGI
ncbi:MAG: hypothetical protein ABW098_18845 [Candidatus Thiodiazotropha sp.]